VRGDYGSSRGVGGRVFGKGHLQREEVFSSSVKVDGNVERTFKARAAGSPSDPIPGPNPATSLGDARRGPFNR
jgi:hypothetical protein